MMSLEYRHIDQPVGIRHHVAQGRGYDGGITVGNTHSRVKVGSSPA
jgi:hypothetical protein